jgi:hypothetical protein
MKKKFERPNKKMNENGKKKKRKRNLRWFTVFPLQVI